MQFEVQAKAPLCRGISDNAKDLQQRLCGGDVRGGLLIPQPIAARARFRQSHASAEAFDRTLHFTGLTPCAVEQDDLRHGMSGEARRGHWLALGMKNPHVPIREQGGRRQAGTPKKTIPAFEEMAGGPLDGAGYQTACARWFVLFVAVQQHVHWHAGGHGRNGVADAPPRRQATPRTAGCTGENDAS